MHILGFLLLLLNTEILQSNVQKQPPKMFHETECSKKIRKGHKKTPLPVSLFLIKLEVSPCNFIKNETLVKMFSGEFCEIFKNAS